jgi:anti-sigma factor RsiW
MFWTKRTGHLSDEDLSVFIDGELRGRRLDAAQRHVASCPDCSAAIDALREVKTLVSRLPQVEPSRSFVLSPSMAGVGQTRPQPAPRRTSFAFVPAVALTLLVALFAADLTVSTSDSSNDEASTASEAMVAKDASSNVAADSAGGAAGAAESQQRSTFAAQPSPNPAAAPSTSGPITGQAPTPATISPQAQTAPSAAGSQPVPVPSQNVAPQTAPQQPPTPASQPPVPPPATGQGAAPSGGLSSEAAPLDNQKAGTLDVGEGDSARDSTFNQASDDGRNWLRIAQIAVAIGFVISALYVFGPGLIKKGHQ